MWFGAFLLFLLQANLALERAWQLAAQGDRSGAEAVLQRLLAQDSQSTDAHLLYGNLLAEDGRKDEAIVELKTAVSQRPKSAEAWNSLGEICSQFGKKQDALEAFNKAVLVDRNFGIAQSNLAKSLYEAGQKDDAQKHAKLAVALLGSSADAADSLYLLGKMELGAGDASNAANHLASSVRIRPDFAPAWSDLGQSRKLLLDDSGSIAAFAQAVKLDPKDAVAQYRLGAEYLRQDKSLEALGPLEAAASLNGEDQSTLNALAAVLQRLGRAAEAARTRRRLAEVIHSRDLDSQNALSALQLNNRGAELEKAGKIIDALDLYKRAVALSGQHAGIRVNYGVALLRTGQWREGLEQLHHAQELDPNNAQIETALKDAISQAPVNELPDWARSAQNRPNQPLH